MKKSRTQIPSGIAAQVQFLSDRTCCVCHSRGKPTQIHHLDEDPSNHDLRNLALLCLECHNSTMIQGGVARKLDAEQVVLYRDNWHQLVATKRAQSAPDQEAASRRRVFRGLLRSHVQKFEALDLNQLCRKEVFPMHQSSVAAIADECAKIFDDIPSQLQAKFEVARAQYCSLTREDVESWQMLPPYCNPCIPVANYERGRRRAVELLKEIAGYAE